MDLTWKSINGTGAPKYVIQHKLDGASSWQSGPTTTNLQQSVTALQPGRVYDFRIGAEHKNGTLGPTSIPIKLRTNFIEPEAPGQVDAAGDAGVTVLLPTLHFNGGQPVQYYEIETTYTAQAPAPAPAPAPSPAGTSPTPAGSTPAPATGTPAAGMGNTPAPAPAPAPAPTVPVQKTVLTKSLNTTIMLPSDVVAGSSVTVRARCYNWVGPSGWTASKSLVAGTGLSPSQANAAPGTPGGPPLTDSTFAEKIMEQSLRLAVSNAEADIILANPVSKDLFMTQTLDAIFTSVSSLYEAGFLKRSQFIPLSLTVAQGVRRRRLQGSVNLKVDYLIQGGKLDPAAVATDVESKVQADIAEKKFIVGTTVIDTVVFTPATNVVVSTKDPGPPTNVLVTSSKQDLTVQYTAPAMDPGVVSLGFTVCISKTTKNSLAPPLSLPGFKPDGCIDLSTVVVRKTFSNIIPSYGGGVALNVTVATRNKDGVYTDASSAVPVSHTFPNSDPQPPQVNCGKATDTSLTPEVFSRWSGGNPITKLNVFVSKGIQETPGTWVKIVPPSSKVIVTASMSINGVEIVSTKISTECDLGKLQALQNISTASPASESCRPDLTVRLLLLVYAVWLALAHL
eukprot:GFYU01009138.1.p1 GENE.GFYU01009138.1~~GFYU01009138.1.p1  ORF type:complete len:636 (-),score=88.80 GFYU01009138.1:22-1887(-)